MLSFVKRIEPCTATALSFNRQSWIKVAVQLWLQKDLGMSATFLRARWLPAQKPRPVQFFLIWPVYTLWVGSRKSRPPLFLWELDFILEDHSQSQLVLQHGFQFGQKLLKSGHFAEWSYVFSFPCSLLSFMILAFSTCSVCFIWGPKSIGNRSTHCVSRLFFWIIISLLAFRNGFRASCVITLFHFWQYCPQYF